MITIPRPIDRRGGARFRWRPAEVQHELCSKPGPCLAKEVPGFDGWIRDASDERARDRGCWFDPVLGGYAVWWIERYCRLYEGRWAGEPAQMHGCKTCKTCKVIPREFDPELALVHNEEYLSCVAAGHDLAWQYDWIMRLFGWLRWDDDLQRPVRRFRKSDLWVPKKNAKSPTLAFVGWHLTVGDGVMGQKVYFGAKDGQQAREIVGGHAVAVYEESMEIQSTTRHRLNEMSFEHEPTKSKMKPLSSSNVRTTKSKEGINGSILIDEVHVVDAEFMSRIKRAGISRDEPFVIGVSTAGLDVLGYGKERQDYGRRVADGQIDDDDYLYVCYEAPQDTDLEDITTDEVVALGKACNPNWGITILEREFRADFEECRNSTLDSLLDFGTYRLNIWQAGAAPWLSWSSWEKCAGDYTLEDLEGKSCSLGLDLSRTRDMTAVSFAFALEEGRRRYWPMFWIPEKTAQRYRHVIPQFSDWVSQGLISVCRGYTISHQQVLDELVEVLNRLACDRVYYDPQFADWISEQLEFQHNLERVIFDQTLKAYTPPTDQFEAELLDGTFCHPSHPVLSWQAQHVHVYRARLDRKQKRPVKPEADNISDPRTVDGIQACVMGLMGQMVEDYGFSFAVA